MSNVKSICHGCTLMTRIYTDKAKQELLLLYP